MSFDYFDSFPILPKVGVAIFIRNGNEILLGYRLSKLGKDTWGLPGGKLDFGEDLKECAKRELKEETNLDVEIEDMYLKGVTNAIFDNETHYITVIYETERYSGELKVMEPEKCAKWEWFDFSITDNGKRDIPINLFLPLKNFLS
jgi:8-oxo-dGTP diphosphatase